MTEQETAFNDWLRNHPDPRYRKLFQPVTTADHAREVFGAAGDGLRAGADAAAHNRGVQFDADLARAELQQNEEDLFSKRSIAREQEGRDKQKHAWQTMNRASYVANAPADLNTPRLSPYSKSIAGPSAEQRLTSRQIAEQAMREIQEGNTLEMPRRTATDIAVQPPGRGERIGGIVGPIANVASRVPASWWARAAKWIP